MMPVLVLPFCVLRNKDIVRLRGTGINDAERLCGGRVDRACTATPH